MSGMYADNDGRFPDDSPVLVQFPLSPEQIDRESWTWLPGHVLGQCGPNEWHVVVDGVPELAEVDEPGDEPMYPAPFRNSCQLRAVES